MNRRNFIRLAGGGTLAAATAKAAAAELRPELAGSTRACLLRAVAAALAALALAAKAARRAVAAGAAGISTLQRAGALLEGGGHNLRGQVEELTQILDARVGQEPAGRQEARQ